MHLSIDLWEFALVTASQNRKHTLDLRSVASANDVPGVNRSCDSNLVIWRDPVSPSPDKPPPGVFLPNPWQLKPPAMSP